MKNKFDLHIYLSRIEHLLNLKETLTIIAKPAPEFFELMDNNLQVNQTSLVALKKFMDTHYGVNFEDYIEGIYFGQETCENLIPSTKHLQEAVEFCKRNEYQFTFVTPYVGPKGMERLRKHLDYLNQEVKDAEVVVNDYGVLHLLDTEFSNLTPIIGRLLNKMKRDPRFSMSGFDISNIEIKNLKRVEENQKEAIKASSFELPVYQDFLKEKGVERISVDTLSQTVDAKTLKKWGFPVDLYWPWTYITSSRSCAIAAHTQPGKDSHPTSEPCKFQCRKYEFTFRSDKRMLPTVFRGNAVWMSTRSLSEDYFGQGFGRLVFEPYIPV
ncbi:MAG: hypothetical protein JW801_04635 [Bacteroidales bacterium]|nr:hypothetical protein [Bacteroidales bacterium]